MESMIALTSAPVPLGEYVPSADQRVVLRGVGWQGYQALLTLRGERRRPKVAYLDGAVELMTTSREHEGIKGTIGRLVEVYCDERRLAWSTFGNWTLDDESEDAGAEPDECYIFGPTPGCKERPELVIEVVWTSGGINKLEIYRRLGIAEVWFWKTGAISVYQLTANGYEPRPASIVVPGIDLAMIAELVHIEPTSDATAQLRERLRATDA